MIGFICFIVVYTVEIVITGMVVAKLFANPTNAVLFALLGGPPVASVVYLFRRSHVGQRSGEEEEDTF